MALSAYSRRRIIGATQAVERMAIASNSRRYGKIYGSGRRFTGKAYNSQGQEFDVNTNAALPWVVYDANTDTFSENAGPPPDLPGWPPHQIWYRKAGTAGDIVVKRIG